MIFDGKTFAFEKEQILKEKILKISQRLARRPKLLAVGVGEKEKDVALYISMKEKTGLRIGIDFEKKIFNVNTPQSLIENFLFEKNKDKTIDGILLELPVPKEIDPKKLMSFVSPLKDPDCMTLMNLGEIYYPDARILPATVQAIVEILKEAYKTDPSKKFLSFQNVVVVGGGIELGKPLSLVLSEFGASVSLCRSTTKKLFDYTRNADVVISAVGHPGLITPSMVKKGVVIIDAGINFVKGKPVGDVKLSTAKRARFFTPVPGGVGPVTIVSLFENLLKFL